jgi:hypothetical protein
MGQVIEFLPIYDLKPEEEIYDDRSGDVLACNGSDDGGGDNCGCHRSPDTDVSGFWILGAILGWSL